MKGALLISGILFCTVCFGQVERSTNSIKIVSLDQPVRDTSAKISFHCGATITKARHPLVVIDGKRVAYNSIRSLDPNTIERIHILKDKEATKKYGKKAKYGVIIIELKKSAAPVV
jgi:hypothetical protein